MCGPAKTHRHHVSEARVEHGHDGPKVKKFNQSTNNRTSVLALVLIHARWFWFGSSRFGCNWTSVCGDHSAGQFLKKEQCPDTLDYKSVPELKASAV